jgi:hypothetical protein
MVLLGVFVMRRNVETAKHDHRRKKLDRTVAA